VEADDGVRASLLDDERRDEWRCAPRIPVGRRYVAACVLQPELRCDREHPSVDVVTRSAESSRRSADEAVDDRVGAEELLANSVVAAVASKTRMRPGVIAYLMTVRMDSMQEIGPLLDGSTDHEERCARGVRS